MKKEKMVIHRTKNGGEGRQMWKMQGGQRKRDVEKQKKLRGAEKGENTNVN